jgi:hypothetical protein
MEDVVCASVSERVRAAHRARGSLEGLYDRAQADVGHRMGPPGAGEVPRRPSEAAPDGDGRVCICSATIDSHVCLSRARRECLTSVSGTRSPMSFAWRMTIVAVSGVTSVSVRMARKQS